MIICDKQNVLHVATLKLLFHKAQFHSGKFAFILFEIIATISLNPSSFQPPSIVNNLWRHWSSNLHLTARVSTLLQLACITIFWSLSLYLGFLIRLFPYHSFERLNANNSFNCLHTIWLLIYLVQILQILITAAAGLWKQDLRMYVPNNVIIFQISKYNLWKKKI